MTRVQRQPLVTQIIRPAQEFCDTNGDSDDDSKETAAFRSVVPPCSAPFLRRILFVAVFVLLVFRNFTPLTRSNNKTGFLTRGDLSVRLVWTSDDLALTTAKNVSENVSSLPMIVSKNNTTIAVKEQSTASPWMLQPRKRNDDIAKNPNETKPALPHPPPRPAVRLDLVQDGDYIYAQQGWDSSPIVLEKHRLIFFTTPKVACTGFKQLFRRVMGYDDWNAFVPRELPWNPQFNGLTYLSDFNRIQASFMMTSPLWTRAIFVRDPISRFVSAYRNKAVNNPDYIQRVCCPETLDCVPDSATAFYNLINTRKSKTIRPSCRRDPHWTPQSNKMEDKYWPYIDFVGRYENLMADAIELFTHVGIWDDYGASGWGKNGTTALFAPDLVSRHATHTMTDNTTELLLTPELIQHLESYYAKDYMDPHLGIAYQRQNVAAALENEDDSLEV